MENLQDKYSIHMSDKRRIAQYAASLIKKDDFVYLDAGSTTEQMADFLAGSEATFVTNSIPLAQKLGAAAAASTSCPDGSKAIRKPLSAVICGI